MFARIAVFVARTIEGAHSAVRLDPDADVLEFEKYRRSRFQHGLEVNPVKARENNTPIDAHIGDELEAGPEKV
jgi:hypothetical protein